MPKEVTNIHFAAIAGTYMDFSLMDLSPWGIQGGLIESKETEDYIKSISMGDFKDRNWDLIKEEAQGVIEGEGLHVDWKYMNLLWPFDLNNPPSEQDYFEAIEAIRIGHPSEIYVKNIFGAQYFHESGGIHLGGWSSFASYSFYKYDEPELRYFLCSDEYIDETNKFFKLYKERADGHGYIENAIRYYCDSFRVNSPEMSFICLCICLETLVPGKEQLSFRFRRNLAVLCGESAEDSALIYEKAKNLYNYRSKLVHSGMSSKDFKQFYSFFEYAQFLASRMIIEMLLHYIPKIEDLDKRITELGFGNGCQISEGYTPLKPSLVSWAKVSHYDF